MPTPRACASAGERMSRSRVGPLVADHALHEGALARAVLPEKGVERSRGHAERDVVEGSEAPEALGEADHLELEGGRGHARRSRAASKASERATAPNTP